MIVEIDIDELEIDIDKIVESVANLAGKDKISFENALFVIQELHKSFKNHSGREININIGRGE